MNEEGFREVLAVAEGSKEDKASWTAFLRHLKERGLKGIRLFVSDKCLGLVESLGEFYPEAMWQRCAVSLRPPESSTGTAGGKSDFGPSKGTNSFRPGVGNREPYGPGSYSPGQPSPDASAGGGDEQENLELTIYGGITLYDRPGRPAAPTEGQPQ